MHHNIFVSSKLIKEKIKTQGDNQAKVSLKKEKSGSWLNRICYVCW